MKNIIKKIGWYAGILIGLIAGWPIFFVWYFIDNKENTEEGIMTALLAELVYIGIIVYVV